MPRVRRRVTFLFEDGDPRIETGFDVDEARHVMSTENLNVPRQDRTTIPYEKQDPLIQSVLTNQTVYITWSANEPYFKNVPFKTVVEPGWHIMTDIHSSLEVFDSWFKFDVNDEFSVETPNWRSLFVPGGLDLLEDDIAVKMKLPGTTGTDSAGAAVTASIDSLIISYGSLPLFPTSFQKPNDFVIETYQSKAPQSIIKPAEDEKVEVGILSVSSDYSDLEERDWVLTGLVKNFDEPNFEKAMIHVWPRHLSPPESTYKAYFSKPIGLHPHFILDFDPLTHPRLSGGDVKDGTCKLYAELTIPKALFLDIYQLADLERTVSSGGPTGKLIGAWGETDLEAPVWGVQGWGSEALIEIYPPEDGQAFKFELPMHSRYQFPMDGGLSVNASLPWPAVFWACQDDLNHVTPDFKGLGYPSFFPDDTMFHYVTPRPFPGAALEAKFHVPVAPLQKYALIQNFTLATILLGFFYILYKVVCSHVTFSERQSEKQATATIEPEPVAARTRSHLVVGTDAQTGVSQNTSMSMSSNGLTKRGISGRINIEDE